MKKLFAFAIILMLLLCMSIPAFADLDEGDFDEWYVRCGPAGYSFTDYDYDIDNDKRLEYRDYIEPGTRIMVHSFNRISKTYLLVIDDENHKIKGIGHLSVTEEQLNKYFIGEKQAYNPKYTKKLNKKVECVVTPRVGVVLRQGPDTSYPSFRTIPYNTKLTYQYVLEGEKYNWGYVTYKGRDGWCCIDYTQKIDPAAETTTTTKPTTEATTEASAETTEKATTKPVTVPSTVPTDAPTTEPRTVKANAQAQPETELVVEEDDAPDFFSNTTAVIIICCLGAVILALTAVVILLIVKKKR